jgi:uncharacterized protein YoxC
MYSWKDYILPYLVGLCALAVSGSAAFYSVTGLAKLFAGASTEVIIMTGSLEFSKLVIASLLYRYWKELNKALKYYLSFAAVVLVLITSMGIYGFLSNAFQQQALTIGQVEQEVQLYQNQIDQLGADVGAWEKRRESLVQLRTSQEGRLDRALDTGVGISTSRNQINDSNREIQTLNQNIEQNRKTIVDLSGKISQIKGSNLDVEREIGGFRFIAEAFGLELITVVKWFIIVLVLVFDPLAISLVIASNFLFIRLSNKEELEIYKPLNNNNMAKINKNTTAENKGTAEDVQEVPFFDEIVVPQELLNKVEKEEKLSTKSPIVKVLQKTPSGFSVLRADGSRDKLTKAEYNAEFI